jgi:radical SAM protein with 4Fe4S-binding SPASM domain
MSLMAQLNDKALRNGVPLSVHLDITYRCNERCEHCYLEHHGRDELTTPEIRTLLDQLAEAGVFFLTISGGEPFLRPDCLEIIAYARSLAFNLKLKTNALLIGPREAARLRELNVEQIQVSVYSHRPEVHDAITKVPGSLHRTMAAIKRLRSYGLKVTIANVLMKSNHHDSEGVRRLAQESEAHYSLDPTITPMMNGDTGILDLRLPASELRGIFQDPNLVGDVAEFCAPPSAIDESVLDGYSCSAGHTACYITPQGDVYPCVQFPLPCGNIRRQPFAEIWQDSAQLNEVRSIRARDLPTCSSCSHLGSCTRCPGLAYMEGNMRGSSTADCEKSFIRTGVVTAGMLARKAASANLVQIQL